MAADVDNLYRLVLHDNEIRVLPRLEIPDSIFEA
jgi:hypothetical protein